MTRKKFIKLLKVMGMERNQALEIIADAPRGHSYRKILSVCIMYYIAADMLRAFLCHKTATNSNPEYIEFTVEYDDDAVAVLTAEEP